MIAARAAAGLALWVWVGAAGAWAQPAQTAGPRPDYRAELGDRLAAQVEAQSGSEPEAAARLGARIDDRVGPLAPVRYATGLAFNRAGDRATALIWYDRCLELDPLHRGALYDRAELRLLGGDTIGAKTDLALLRAHPPVHWSTHLRLAQLAAIDGDSTAFERELIAALAVGFELRTLGLDPVWRAWIDDPTLGPIVRRLIAVYGSDGLLQQIQTPP